MLLALTSSLRWKYFFRFLTESMICLFGFWNASLKAHVEEHRFSPTTFQRNIWMDSSSPNLRRYLIAGGSQAANATKRFCRVASCGTAGSGRPGVRADRARPRLLYHCRSLLAKYDKIPPNSSAWYRLMKGTFTPSRAPRCWKEAGGVWWMVNIKLSVFCLLK